jgi:hypothetical protein
LDTEGDDFAAEFVRADLFKGADGRHFAISVFRFEPAPLRPRWRLDGRRRSAPHPSGPKRERRTAEEQLSCLVRNGRSPGEESRDAPLRLRRSRR